MNLPHSKKCSPRSYLIFTNRLCPVSSTEHQRSLRRINIERRDWKTTTGQSTNQKWMMSHLYRTRSPVKYLWGPDEVVSSAAQAEWSFREKSMSISIWRHKSFDPLCEVNLPYGQGLVNLPLDYHPWTRHTTAPNISISFQLTPLWYCSAFE